MKKLPVIAMSMLLACACGEKTVETEAAPEATAPGEELKPGATPVVKNLIGPYQEVFNDSNYIQYEAAERMGIDPIETVRLAYNTKRPIVKVETCDDYKIDYLTHSMPYLVPEAAKLLEDIGKAFGDSLEAKGKDRKNRIIVTSLLRSPYTVRKLMKVNINAVDSSTHKFATTFDIAYNNFDTQNAARPSTPAELKAVLAEVLLDQRNQGKCFVKYELQSPCFHITVCK